MFVPFVFVISLTSKYDNTKCVFKDIRTIQYQTQTQLSMSNQGKKQRILNISKLSAGLMMKSQSLKISFLLLTDLGNIMYFALI